MTTSERRNTRRAALSPLLARRTFGALSGLRRPTRLVLCALITDLRVDARARALASWKARKGPMAAYWAHVAAHAGLVLRALGAPRPHRPEVSPGPRSPANRNPALRFPAMIALGALPPSARAELACLLRAVHAEAGRLADTSWPRAPDRAAYWRAASVYAGHFYRAVPHAASREQHVLDLPATASAGTAAEPTASVRACATDASSLHAHPARNGSH